MILISESCYARQRISLKIVIHSRVRFIAAYVSVQINGNFASLLHVSPKCNISRPMDYFEFFSSTDVYDLHLIAPKFKT